jgi:hypothetical protein
MATKKKLPIIEGTVPEREFEALLRRASESQKVARPHLLKKVHAPRRARVSA